MMNRNVLLAIVATSVTLLLLPSSSDPDEDRGEDTDSNFDDAPPIGEH
jgi:hypothetical protein